MQQRRCLHLMRKMVLQWQNRQIKEGCRTTCAAAAARRQLLLDKSQLVGYPRGTPGQVERYTQEQTERLLNDPAYANFPQRLQASTTARVLARETKARAAEAVGAQRAAQFVEALRPQKAGGLGRSSMLRLQLEESSKQRAALGAVADAEALDAEAEAGAARAEDALQEASLQAAAEEEEEAEALAAARLELGRVQPADDDDNERPLHLADLGEGVAPRDEQALRDDEALRDDDGALLRDDDELLRDDDELLREDDDEAPLQGGVPVRGAADAVCEAKLGSLLLTGEIINFGTQTSPDDSLSIHFTPGKRDALTFTFVVISTPADSNGKRDVNKTFSFRVPATCISLLQRQVGSGEDVDTLVMDLCASIKCASPTHPPTCAALPRPIDPLVRVAARQGHPEAARRWRGPTQRLERRRR